MNGLWTITYDMGVGELAVCVTFNDGTVTGGNETYYYLGQVEQKGEAGFTGTVTAHHYKGPLDPVFNAKTIPLEFSGEIKGEQMSGTAVAGGHSLAFIGTKRG